MDEHDLTWVDVKHDVMEKYNEELQRALDEVEVWQADVNGYYRVGDRIVTQWPGSMSSYRDRTEQVDLDAYETA
jgi:protocatechuate 3,4-dioxygenase beta subunit